MSQLPKVGWLHRCEDCETITSRVTTCKYKRDTIHLSICIGCRPVFRQWLQDNFTQVITESETIGQQILQVTK